MCFYLFFPNDAFELNPQSIQIYYIFILTIFFGTITRIFLLITVIFVFYEYYQINYYFF
jgi:hypothetical protein